MGNRPVFVGSGKGKLEKQALDFRKAFAAWDSKPQKPSRKWKSFAAISG